MAYPEKHVRDKTESKQAKDGHLLPLPSKIEVGIGGSRLVQPHPLQTDLFGKHRLQASGKVQQKILAGRLERNAEHFLVTGLKHLPYLGIPILIQNQGMVENIHNRLVHALLQFRKVEQHPVLGVGFVRFYITARLYRIQSRAAHGHFQSVGMPVDIGAQPVVSQ